MNENTFIDSFFSLTPPEIQISGKYIDFFGFSKKKKDHYNILGKLKFVGKLSFLGWFTRVFMGVLKSQPKK